MRHVALFRAAESGQVVVGGKHASALGERGLAVGLEFRPDPAPAVGQEHLAGELAFCDLLDADSRFRLHVADSGQALVQIAVVDARQGGEFAALCW